MSSINNQSYFLFLLYKFCIYIDLTILFIENQYIKNSFFNVSFAYIAAAINTGKAFNYQYMSALFFYKGKWLKGNFYDNCRYGSYNQVSRSKFQYVKVADNNQNDTFLKLKNLGWVLISKACR